MLDLPTLSSNGIILKPLMLTHTNDLTQACQDGELWKINVTSVPEPDKVIDYINTAASMADRKAFVVKRLAQRVFMIFYQIANA